MFILSDAPLREQTAADTFGEDAAKNGLERRRRRVTERRGRQGREEGGSGGAERDKESLAAFP